MTRGTALVWGLGVGMGCIAVACGGPSKLASKGQSCFRATDCDLGLICGPERTCTDDTSSIDIHPDASATTGAGGTASGPGPDASVGQPDATGASGGPGSTGAGGATGLGGSAVAGAAGTSDDASPN